MAAQQEPSTYAAVKAKVAEVAEKTRGSITEVAEKGKEIASDPHVQVTTASAVGGGAVAGTAGGATGAVTGGVVGAVVGVPAALFTFGLSIPFCAVVGAAVGGGTGATVGATTGAVGGGTAGYYGYKHKDEIKATATAATTKVTEARDSITKKAKETAETVSAGYTSVSDKVSTALGRGGSTGGTATEVKLTK